MQGIYDSTPIPPLNKYVFKDVNAASCELSSKIAAIDFHDARLDSMTIRGGGNGSISFSHIDVYIEESSDHYGIWRYRGELLLQGIEQLSLDRHFDNSDCVIDGSIIDAAGHEIELASVQEWTNADKVTLTFSSAQLSMEVSQVQLSNLTPIEKYEEWNGPLVSDSTQF